MSNPNITRRKKPGPAGRSSIDLEAMEDAVDIEAVAGERISNTGGSWKKLYDRMLALPEGKGFRVPLTIATMDPERAARTVRSAVRNFVKAKNLPTGSFGVWALAQGVFVWRAKADDLKAASA